MMPRKRCPQCKIRKPICLFWDNVTTEDGKDQVCMKCRQVVNRERNLAYKPRPSGERPFAQSLHRRKKVAVG